MASNFTVTHVRFSQKHFIKFVQFEMNMIIIWNEINFEKLLQRKETQFSLLKVLWHIETMASYYRVTHVRFSQKHFMKLYTLKWTWLSFQVKLLQRKGTLFSLLTKLWYIPNRHFSFWSNTCAFLTKAFHEILTLSNERNYLPK